MVSPLAGEAESFLHASRARVAVSSPCFAGSTHAIDVEEQSTPTIVKSGCGNDCTSGDECCEGFCRMEDGGAMTCSPMSGGCSHEFEKCTTSADCCDSGYDCVNGKCAQPPPPK
jgi:hypothetical protein